MQLSRSSEGEIIISMQQGKPVFLDPHPDKSSLATALGITDVHGIGLEYKGIELDQPRVVTTSPARHLLVPVRNRGILKGISFADKERLSRELARTKSHNSGVYVFTSVDECCTHVRFEARFFSPAMGMEDPATGSAAGPLAAYLWDRGVLGWKRDEAEYVDVEVVQGLRTGRECLMRVSVKPDAEGRSVTISISGTGVWVAGGEIVVPMMYLCRGTRRTDKVEVLLSFSMKFLHDYEDHNASTFGACQQQLSREEPNAARLWTKLLAPLR
jgi:PhzF family phenazine biosynthesis protein